MAPFVLSISQVSTRYLFFPTLLLSPPLLLSTSSEVSHHLVLKISFSSACLTCLLFCCHLSGCPSISASLSQIFLVPTCLQLCAAHLSCCDVMWCGVIYVVLCCDVVSCHVMSCPVMSCHVVWCALLWCSMMWWDLMRWDVIRCDKVWWIWYDAMWLCCHVMWCDWCDEIWCD